MSTDCNATVRVLEEDQPTGLTCTDHDDLAAIRDAEADANAWRDKAFEFQAALEKIAYAKHNIGRNPDGEASERIAREALEGDHGR